MLADYEVFEVSSDDDAAVDDGEDEVLPSGAVRKRKVLLQKEYIPSVPVAVAGGKLTKIYDNAHILETYHESLTTVSSVVYTYCQEPRIQV